MAGELGATLIIQKEIVLPPALYTPGSLDPTTAYSAPHLPSSLPLRKSTATPALTDGETSSSDDVASKSRAFHRPNHPALTSDHLTNTSSNRSSPQPIIRDYPYGYNAWSYSRNSSSATSPRGTPSSLPRFDEADSDVDDDAAFAFDLDIGNFSSRASPSPTSTVVLSTDGNAAASHDGPPQRLHRMPKHKKPKLLPPPAVDPVEKALRRRERRELSREKQQRLDPLYPGGNDRAVDGLKAINAADDRKQRAKLGAQTGVSGERNGSAHLGRDSAALEADDSSCDPVSRVPSEDFAVERFIAEALIVRKFTVEVEESFLELDKLSL